MFIHCKECGGLFEVINESYTYKRDYTATGEEYEYKTVYVELYCKECEEIYYGEYDEEI